MQLECTKKLLEYLKVKPCKPEEPVDPLFLWSANLITLNRRKCLVAVHPASCCAFVLYGVTAKLLPKLPELLLEGIRGLLQSEYVRPEIIENYLDDCGRQVTFASNSSRKAVTRCNMACQRVERFVNLFEPEDLYQKRFLPWINDDLALREERGYVYDVLLRMLGQRYGENVQSCRALELEVELELLTPCKRRIVVPEDLTFYQLHRILQTAFGWEDCHLHRFILERDQREIPTKILQTGADMEEQDYFGHTVSCEDSTVVTLGQVFSRSKRIWYEYDFGDDWIHVIRRHKILNNCTEPYPHCALLLGETPPEDSGGPYGYAHKLEILNDPSHPMHDEITQWMGPNWRQTMDQDKLNLWLRDAHRRCIPVYYG